MTTPVSDPLDTEPDRVTNWSRPRGLDGYVVHVVPYADQTWHFRVVAPNNKSVSIAGEGLPFAHAVDMACRLYPTLPVHIHTKGGSTEVIAAVQD